jgi:hypothetical protein
MKYYEKEYCMVCGNENPQDREVCDCGGRDFVFGDKFTYVDGKVICNCGSLEFRMSTHVDFNDFANTTYVCTKCGNPVAVQTHRDNYWDDGEEF